MRSLKICTKDKFFRRKISNNCRLGFSLIETIIVLGIVTFLLSVGLLINTSAFRSYYFISEDKLIASLLRSARSRAVNNLNQSSHGLFVSDEEFELFQGLSFNPDSDLNENFERNGSIEISFEPEEPLIIFENLTGQPNQNKEITLTDGVRSSVIIIENEGRIEW